MREVPRSRLQLLELVFLISLALAGLLAPIAVLATGERSDETSLLFRSLWLFFVGSGLFCSLIGAFLIVDSLRKKRFADGRAATQAIQALGTSSQGLFWLAVGLSLIVLQLAYLLIAFFVLSPG